MTSDVPESVLDDLVTRARAVEPDVMGVFVFGSHARGEAAPTSDLDLQVVTRTPPSLRYRTWFVGELHVSLGIRSVEEIRARCLEPASWSLGLETASGGRWLWSEAEAVAALGDPPGFSHPADPAELEDFVESCAKALRAQDALALRVAARMVGETATPLLRDLNSAPVVHTCVEAVRAATSFGVAPDGWAADLPVLLGLAPATDADVRVSIERVARGVLQLLREQGSGAGDRQPDLTRYLLDGTLERHLGFA